MDIDMKKPESHGQDSFYWTTSTGISGQEKTLVII